MNSTMRKLIALLMVLVLAVCAFAACKNDEPSETPGTGDSTPDTGDTGTEQPKPTDVVEIASEAELLDAAAKIAADTDGYASKTFRLTADIALSADFAPITGFTGVFDGQFHTISGLTIDSDLAEVGLFSTLQGATVMNLVIADAAVANAAPDAEVGILAGSAENATVSCVTVSGSVTLGGRAVAGGLVGSAADSTLLNVKSTATLEGAGNVAGGLVGRLDEKAMLINAYSGAGVTATAGDKAAGVAVKAADSAVAFVMVSEGDVVAREETLAWMPSYIIACQTGGEAADMGWNAADWDVSGEEPALKTDLAKPGEAPAVTVDGTAATVKYGEALPTGLQPETDENNVARAGYLLDGDAYYAALPVVNDMALTTATVDYSLLAGQWVALDADGAAVTVAQALTLGADSYTRVWATEEDGLPMLFFADAHGEISRLALHELTADEKSAYGYTAEGAALLSFGPADGDEAALYMPVPGAFRGAWEVGGSTVIYTSMTEAEGGANSFASFTVGLARSTYRTCVQLSDSGAVLLADGWAMGEEDGAPVLLRGSEKAAASTDYFEGSWYDAAGNSLDIADGKLGDDALTLESTAQGTGLRGPDGTLYVATIGGMNAVTDAGETLFGNADFSGDWVLLEDGKVLTLRIDGLKVYINGAATAVTGSVSVDTETGNVRFSFEADGKTYTYVRNGVVLTDTAAGGKNYYAAEAVRDLYGNYVLGSAVFGLDGAQLTVTVNGVAQPAQNLTILYENNTLKLSAGGMVFARSGGRMTLTGYASIRQGVTTLNLFTPDELADLFGKLTGSWIAPSTSIRYDRLAMVFDASHVMKVDGALCTYEVALVNGEYVVYVSCVYEGELELIELTPQGGLLATAGAALGTMMPEALANAVGDYYESLTGPDEEGVIPEKIGFNFYGGLTVGGKEYGVGEYTLKTNTDGSAFIEAGGLLVTFNGDKSLTVDGKTYYNINWVIPADSYNQLGQGSGSAALEVIVGHPGSYETDEEEGGQTWVPGTYPLFGFRYTANWTTYTSGNGYTWAHDGDQVTVTVEVYNSDGEMLQLVITLPYGNDFHQITVKAGDGEAVEMYSNAYLETLGGSFANSQHSFSVDQSGTMLVDGVEVEYTYSTEDNVNCFTVGDKVYTIDPATPEIAKCGDEVFYDARYANLAGIELTAVRRNTNVAETKYKLLLTEEGWLFNGEKVTWSAYEYDDDIMRFTVTELIAGEEVAVEWKLETSGGAIQNFGLCFYPNITTETVSDWDQRYFVPSILFGADTYRGTSDVVKVQHPDYTDGFLPFVFLVNNAQYDYADYSYSLVDGVFTVDLGDGNLLTFAEGADGLTVTLNGETLESFTPPALDEFEMPERDIFGDTSSVEVTGGVITVDPDAVWGATVIEVYAPGVWNGYDVIYFTTGGTQCALIKTEAGTFAVAVEVLDLCGEYTLDGQTLRVGLDFASGAPEIVVTLGDTAATDVVMDSANLPYDSENYVGFTVEGKQYFLVPNVLDPDGGNIIAPAELFYLCGRVSLESDYSTQLRIYIGKDADGNAMLVYKVENGYEHLNAEVELIPVEGKPNVYQLTYEMNGETYTDYVGLVSGTDKDYSLLALNADQLARIGSFELADGKTLVISVGAATEVGGTRVMATLLVSYNGAAAVPGDWDSATKNLTFAYTEDETAYTGYVLVGDDGSVSVQLLEAAQNAFIGEDFKLAGGGYSDSADVTYGPDGFVVTFRDNPTEKVYFNDDNTRLYFTQDGVEYCLVMVDPNSTGYYDYDRAAIVTAAQAKWLGKYTLEGGKLLQVMLSAGYSPAISASYGTAEAADTVSDLVFQADNLISFRVGQFYHGALMAGDGSVSVTENILDTTAPEYAYLGNYAEQGIVFGFALSVGEDGQLVARYTVTRDGEELTYTIDTALRVIVITEEDGSKTYYTRCMEVEDPLLAELDEEIFALLGSYTAGGHTVTLLPYFTASYSSWSDEYTYKEGYTLSLDGGEAMEVAFSKDNAQTPNRYIRFTSDGKTYLFFVTEPGVSAVLHELTAEQVGMLGIHIANDNYDYLDTSLVFSADGSFTLGLTFDGAPVDETVPNDYGYSFQDAEGNTWYVITGGSSPYIVSEAQYGWYMQDVTVGGHTITVQPGSSSYYMYEVIVDGVKAEDVEFIEGTYCGLQFTVGDVTYVLARNTTADNALVLNVLDASMGASLSFSKYVTITMADGTQYSGTLKAVVAIDAEGNLSVAWDFGDNPTPSEVAILESPEGVNADCGVLKVTINGSTAYGLMHPWSEGSSSYDLVWVTDVQYAMMGTWDVNGVTLVIGLNEPAYSAYMQVTYNGETVTSGSYQNVNSGDPCFKTVEIDGVSTMVCAFTLNDGSSYYAYLVNGVMTVTEAAA